MVGVICRFEVAGDQESPEAVTVDVLVSAPVTVSAVRSAFPYLGEWHFRQKILLREGSPFVWMDLIDGREELLPGEVAGKPTLEIKVRQKR